LGLANELVPGNTWGSAAGFITQALRLPHQTLI